jgi:epoxyqueuosine reductase
MRESLRRELEALALRQGFVSLSVAAARPALADRAAALERVRQGAFLGLPWFTAERVIRATEPEQLLPGARSVILLAASYSHPVPVRPDRRPRGRIARYAWGRDYHRVLERRARPLLGLLEERLPGCRSRFFVDHGPLMERAYARSGGLGWQGKNTMILDSRFGSYTFLAAIVTTADLGEDPPTRQHCGTCTRCLAACPTGALRSAYELVNDLCIAFQTIENRGPIPRPLRPLLGDWIFGCDLCQEACPVNEVRAAPGLPEFAPREAEDAFPDLVELVLLSEADFRRRFAGRPVLRAGHAGLLRNACVALGNLGNPIAIPALTQALKHPLPLVRGHAAWALGRLGASGALLRALPEESDPGVREEIETALAGSIGEENPSWIAR